MDFPELETLARKLMGKRKTRDNRETGFIFNHGRRVGFLATKLRSLVAADYPEFDDLIYLAGLYHDIGRGIEPHSWSGAVLAREILKEHLAKEELETVLDIISNHNRILPGAEHPFYIRVIQDADLLDHMGTMEVWLKFFDFSSRGDGPEGVLEYWKSEDYQRKTVQWRNRLNFEESKKIFDERMEFLKRFIRRMERENNGEIFGLEEMEGAPE